MIFATISYSANSLASSANSLYRKRENSRNDTPQYFPNLFDSYMTTLIIAHKIKIKSINQIRQKALTNTFFYVGRTIDTFALFSVRIMMSECAGAAILIIIMGIVRLGQFFKTKFKGILQPYPARHFRGQKLAVDASSTIYSFLVKTVTFTKNRVNVPSDAHGNQTGHLIGLLYRALLCKELNIQATWVFDGRPPQHKYDELYRRRQLKQEALARADTARDLGDIQQAVNQSKRSIFITQQEREDAKTLLTLMGQNVVQAPSEGESQCAWLAREGLVQGILGEDIDTLVFGAPFLVRGFNREGNCTFISLQNVLATLGLTQSQFVDFCILCGCDYTAKIPKIGPVKALQLIKAHGKIQAVVAHLQEDDKLRGKHPIPDDFNYLIARRLFEKPNVTVVKAGELTPKAIKEEELKQFLLEKSFELRRVENWLCKAKEFDQKNVI